MSRPRRNHLRETIHLLNQRYYQQWHRAERLERELSRIRRRWWGPLLGLLLWLKRALLPLRSHPLESLLPTGETIAEPDEPATGKISVIIPFRDQIDLLRNCLRSLRRTMRGSLEIILVDNGSREPRTLRVLDRLRQRHGIKVVTWPGAFNFSMLCNAGARQAGGDFLLFLNNDTEALTPNWSDRLIRLANHPEVGIVGSLLLYPDQTIQHVGLYPDAQGRWVHAGRGHLASEVEQPRVVPGVTGACLFVSRALFHEVGGFDENLPLTYNDVDLCHKVQQRGLKCVVTPRVKFLHYEGLTRGFSGDQPGVEHLEAISAFPSSS